MLPPNCLQDGSRSQLGANLDQLGSILASSWPPRSARDPPKAPQEPPKRPLKVAISLENGGIFQYKVVLNYFTFTYSCHVLPSCLQLASKLPPSCLKIATWAQLGPTWSHLGLILAPKRPPRGCQEAPRRSQAATSSS